MDRVHWFLTGPFLCGALAGFIAGAAWKILRIARMPRHMRWELYPLPRLGPEGSKYQQVDFSRHSRHGGRLAEYRFMAVEILLLKKLFHGRRDLWLGSLLMHAGLYLGALFLGLMVLETIGGLLPLGASVDAAPLGESVHNVGQIANLPCLWQVGNLPHVTFFGERAIHAAALAAGVAGAALGLMGTLLLLGLRFRDPGLRAMSDRVSYFNLLLLAAMFGSGLSAWLAHLAVAANGEPVPLDSLLPAVFSVLLGAFLLYLPFSRMFHFAAKYFFYHRVLWDDESLRPGSTEERAFADYLDHRTSWSGEHLKAGTTWREQAANPQERTPQ